jgi:Type II secretion system (T2SS), protein F
MLTRFSGFLVTTSKPEAKSENQRTSLFRLFRKIDNVIERDINLHFKRVQSASGPSEKEDIQPVPTKNEDKSPKKKSAFSLRRKKTSSERKDTEDEKRDELHSDESVRKGRANGFELSHDKGDKKEGEKPNSDFRRSIQRFAFSIFGKRLPKLPELQQAYDQSGIPLTFEAYLSTGFLLSGIIAVSSFAASFLIEFDVFRRAPAAFLLVGSFLLAGVALGISLVIWLYYPLLRRRTYKSKLENQLPYSFGILGVLAAAGMSLERLFERIAESESNPVLAVLAKRFLRNVKLFGQDTETALAEVAEHSPSDTFARMLDSISVAHKTTGSIHDLVMFESSRLLQEKRDSLRKTIGSLAVMAELYITLVVVGPIIFIVMMAIFGLLPAGGLLPPISVINLIVFVGIPVLSVTFILILDSIVSKA